MRLRSLVLLGTACLVAACGPVGDRSHSSSGDFATDAASGGKADDPDGTGNTGDAPPEVVALAPEFFDFERVFADTGIGVGRSPAGAIFLRARGCDRVARHVEALGALRRRIDPSFGDATALAPAVPLERGWCEAKLDPVLTPYLAQTFWKAIDDTMVDTNCWAHALKTVEAIPSMVAAEADLFTHVLASPACTMLDRTQTPEPGDIVSIRLARNGPAGWSLEESHGVVWLTDELWITKNGASRFDVAPAATVLDAYGSVEGKPYCSERSDGSVTAAQLEDCGFVVQAYRCQSLPELAAQDAAGLPLFASSHARVRGLLDHRVLMQQEAELEQELDEGVVARGTAYVSRHPFDYVMQAYFVHGVPIPASVEAYLARARDDARLRYDYDLEAPELDPLPAPLLGRLEAEVGPDWRISVGDGFELFCDYFRAEHEALFEQFEQAASTLSTLDRSVMVALLLQMGSSDCRSWDVLDALSPYIEREPLVP